MHTFSVALTATAMFAASAMSQMEYTVWSSVIFQRTGERTPEAFNVDATILTTTGAQQSFNAGSFFRNRYITGNSTGSQGIGGQGASLFGLNVDVLDSYEVIANTLDEQFTVATAQAFLQGLYPPWTPQNVSSPGYLADSSILANGSYIDAPLNGYQYQHVHAANQYDPNYLYLDSRITFDYRASGYGCPNWASAAIDWDTTPDFQVTRDDYDGIYDAIGSAVLLGLPNVISFPYFWDYYSAYAIYDYLSYQYAHNATVKTILDRYYDVRTNISYMTTLRWLADEQNFAQLGNLSAHNYGTKSDSLPNAAPGSISTIAGNMLASKILGALENAVFYEGQYYKLNLLVADFQPLMSFFAINNMQNQNSYFTGLPEYGSSAVFELFSYTNSSSTNKTFPREEDLWVRFFFRNGTEDMDGDRFRSYSLFGRGRDESDMLWSDFKGEMQNLMVGEVGTWCEVCGAVNASFCPWFQGERIGSDGKAILSGGGSGRGGKVSPEVGGVIGAIVALAVAGLLFGAAMLFGGVRLHRNPSSKRNSDLGGFKGGQKMRSDQDLTIPKGGAVVGASVEQHDPISPVAGGHERMGSWELKEGAPQISRGPSMEEFRRTPEPFAEENARPVVPSERV